MNASFDLGLHKLRARYRAGTLSCSAVIEEVLRRIATAGDDKVWISRASDTDLRAHAAQLDAELARDPSLLDRQPLFGVPFAVKDNIDVAGMTTTAACPGFAYDAKDSSDVVQRLTENPRQFPISRA